MNIGGRFLRAVLLAALLGTMLPGTAPARYNPGWKWRTVTTGHFTVYYPEGHEAFARRVLALSPEVYADVTGYLGYKTGRIAVVLNPGTDIFNGFYSPLPNRISLFETPSSTIRGFGSTTSDVVDLVFTHEFTHATHITTNSGPYRAATKIFGEGVGFLNVLAPGWYIEGVTTNTETIFTDGGRGRAPEFLGEMRSFADDGTLWDLSAAGTSPYYRPPGGRFYLAGYHMVDYLNRTYGPDTFSRISRYQGRHPFKMAGGAFRAVTKSAPASFYDTFLADFLARTDSVRVAAKATGLPEGNVLIAGTLDGANTHFWTPDGRIRAFRTGYGRHTALVEADPETGAVIREIPLGNVFPLGRIRPLPDGRIVYGEPFYHALGETDLNVTDLVVLDPASGERTRLTRNAHAYSPAVSPDGKRIAATVRNGMWMDLVLTDAEGKNLRRLVSRDSLYWDAPAWSPGGTTVAAALKEGGRTGIALVDVRDGSVRLPFGMDTHGYNEPSFSPDGRWLVFSSDRSGVWNVYAHDLQTARTVRLTAAPYDSAEPLVSPDGRTLSFLSLYEGVNQVRTIPFAPEAGRETAFAPGGPYPLSLQSTPDRGKIAGSRGIPLRAYSPYFRFPVISADEDGATYGVLLMGGDPVGINTYSAMGYYGAESARFGYDVSLANRSLWTDVTVRAYDSALEGNTVGGGNDVWYRERGGEFSLGLPQIIHRIEPDIIVSAFSAGARIRKFDPLKRVLIDPAHDYSAALFGEFAIERVPETPARDLTPGWGQTLALGYEGSRTWMGSELPGYNAIARFTQYAPSPVPHHGFGFTAAHQRQNGRLHYDTAGAIPRGYDDDEPEGGFNLRNTLTFSLDYRFPLWYADRGLGMTMLHLHLLHGSVFADHGAGWNGDFRKDTWARNARTTVGASLRAETTTLYIIPIDFGVQAGYRTVEGDWFAQALIGAPLTGSVGGRTAGFGKFLRGLRWE